MADRWIRLNFIAAAVSLIAAEDTGASISLQQLR
jgi:hypothetical protein